MIYKGPGARVYTDTQILYTLAHKMCARLPHPYTCEGLLFSTHAQGDGPLGAGSATVAAAALCVSERERGIEYLRCNERLWGSDQEMGREMIGEGDGEKGIV